MTQQKKARKGLDPARQTADGGSTDPTPSPEVFKATRAGFTALVRVTPHGDFVWRVFDPYAVDVAIGQLDDEGEAISVALAELDQQVARLDIKGQEIAAALDRGVIPWTPLTSLNQDELNARDAQDVGRVLRAVDEMVQYETRIIAKLLGLAGRAAMYGEHEATGISARVLTEMRATLEVAAHRLLDLANAVNCEAEVVGFQAKESHDE